MSTSSTSITKVEGNGPMTVEALTARVRELEEKFAKSQKKKNSVSMIIFSGDLDHALVAFIIAIACLTMGMEVNMFFCFWGLHLLKDPKKKAKPDEAMLRMMGGMRPNGIPAYRLSTMNFGGLGTWMMKRLMKRKNIISLEERMELVKQMGVKFFACDNSMTMMGLKKEDLITYEHLEIAGAGSFAAGSADNSMTLVF
jgi:peroxiredoxin family protein